jgi:signal transduction histidine kinase
VVATILVMSLMRARARLIAEHQRVLAARATELESFAGRVAHDLKNPLTGVGLRITSALRRSDTDTHPRATLEKVAAQLQRLNQIIDGLLEFARSGASPPAGARADLEEVLGQVIGDLHPAAEAAHAELSVEPFTATQLACSREALTSVLSNLLGNAIKYVVEGRGDPRSIAVRVRHLGRVARVEVEDNGPGLPPGSEERVFEPFQRLAQTHQPGFGLGLATVKKFIDAYDGRVGVRSRAGEGSTFWFEFPSVAAVVHPSMPPAPPGDQSPASPP